METTIFKRSHELFKSLNLFFIDMTDRSITLHENSTMVELISNSDVM